MNPLNTVILEGNVVRDAALSATNKGTAVCNFSVATNRMYKTNSGGFDTEVSFFDVESWGQLADVCSTKCTKGRGVRVVGRLKQNRWKDPDGKGHSHVNIIAEHVEFKTAVKKEGDGEAIVQDDEEANGTAVEALVAQAMEAAQSMESMEENPALESADVPF